MEQHLVYSLLLLLCVLAFLQPTQAQIIRLNSNKSAQVFLSPNYPQDYTNNMAQDYIVTATSSAWVVLNLLDVNIQTGTPCPDKLVIGDSTQSWNRTTCTQTFTRLESYLSQNNMYINFTSDGSTTGRGFMGLIVEAPNQNFFWNTLPTSTCQSNELVLLAQEYDTQYVTLPSWPAVYGNNWQCKWHITAPTEYTIWLRRFRMQLGAGDSIKIWNGKRSFIFCEDMKWEGNTTDFAEFVSNTDNIIIEFTSDGSGTGSGFYLGFEAIVKGDKVYTPTDCNGAGIELMVSMIVVGVLLGALIIGLLIWAKKTNRICVPKTHPYFRPETPVVIREPSYVRPETPPPPPKAPPKYARANQAVPRHMPSYRF